MQTFCGGINRGQLIINRNNALRGDELIFGMDHFQRGRAITHLGKTADTAAFGKLLLLGFGKMEEAQHHRTGAIRDVT